MIIQLSGGGSYSSNLQFFVTNARLVDARYIAADVIEFPVQDHEGNPIGHDWQVTESKPTYGAVAPSAFETIQSITNHLIIPPYYARGELHVTRVRCKRISNSADTTEYPKQIVEITQSELNDYETTATNDIDLYIGTKAETLRVSIPNAGGNFDFYHPSEQENQVTLSLNAPNAIAFRKKPGLAYGSKRFNGTINLPSVATFGEWDIPATGNTKIYLPLIEQFNDASIFYAGKTGGTMDMYLGENLQTMIDRVANRFHLVEDVLTIHIPAGTNKTKTTLDTANIPYVQDYTPTQRDAGWLK